MKEYIDCKTKLIYWDNLDELLIEAKETYKRGMQVFIKDFDIELIDLCENIKNDYKAIQKFIACKELFIEKGLISSLNEEAESKINDIIYCMYMVDSYINKEIM